VVSFDYLLMNNIIHIACAADNSYAQHLGVMITSLCENNRDQKLHIHFFSVDFSPDNLQSVRKLLNQYNMVFSFHPIHPNDVEGFFISHHVSTATYYRLLMPSILSNNIEKLLYLDADMIITKSVIDLWKTNVDDHIIAAIQEPTFNHNERLGLFSNSLYFNAGVLLINLKAWRKNNITSLLVDYIRKQNAKLLFWDQDALNAILFASWLPIKPKWNQQSAFWEKDINTLLQCYSPNDLLEALNDPCIIHYTGSSKPWDYLSCHPRKHIYWKYLRISNWREFRYPNISIIDRVKKIILFLFSPFTKRKILIYFHLGI